MSATITTSTSNGLQEGDRVIIPITLTRWHRFLIWVANPLKWPPKMWDDEFVIASVVSSNTHEIERTT